MTPPLDLDTLAKLEAAATPGPWERSHAAIYGSGLVALFDAKYQGKVTDPTKSSPDARFIVAIRNAAKALIERVRTAEARAVVAMDVALNPHPDDEPDNVRLHRENCDLRDNAKSDAETIAGLRAEVTRLVAGLAAIVNCQSALTRAQTREAAADILKGRAGSRPDQSPFVTRVDELTKDFAKALRTVAELKESECSLARKVKQYLMLVGDVSECALNMQRDCDSAHDRGKAEGREEAAKIAESDSNHCYEKASSVAHSEARSDMWKACADTGKQIAAKIRGQS